MSRVEDHVGSEPRTFYEVMNSDDKYELGSLFFSLLIRQQEWIFRKVETVSMTEDRRFRRQMSIDFLLPPDTLTVAQELGLSNVPVPLLLLQKGLLTALDVRDDSGSSIPVLNREQNGMLARLGLEKVAVDVLAVTRTLGLSDLIEQAVMLSGKDVTVLQRILRDERFNIPEAKDLAAWARWTAETLSTQFILVADLPVQDLSTRRIVKVSYEMDNLVPQSRDGSISIYSPVSYLLKQFGLKNSTFRFPTPEIRNCQSYHFEFRPPTGLDLTKMAFDPDKKMDGTPIFAFSGTSVGNSIGHCNAQLKAQGTAPGSDHPRFSIRAAVSPTTGGLVLGAIASGIIATALLGFGIHVGKSLVDRPTDPTVALLLVIPGVIMTFIIRPGEHILASSLLRRTRVLTMVPGFMAFLAAAELVTGPSVEQMRRSWTFLFCLAALSTLGTASIAVRGWIHHKFGGEGVKA